MRNKKILRKKPVVSKDPAPVSGRVPAVLIIMDGFGLRKEKQGNAIVNAKKPNIDSYFSDYPFTTLEACGESVGLPKGFMGNSEVGHLNIGAGRKVVQQSVKIDNAISDKSFFTNPAFLMAIKNVKRHGTRMHIMGLVQDQGVHAMDSHLFALLKLCKMYKVIPLVHVFTDGRDSEPDSASRYLKRLDVNLKRYGGSIATITGRYYAMDRDKRWDRTKIAYDALINAKGFRAKSWKDALNHAYKDDKKGDEFIRPCILGAYKGMRENDSIIFFNYRGDRARQIMHALVEEDFKDFNTCYVKLFCTVFSEYYDGMNALVAFPKQAHKNILGGVISQHQMCQLRVAETEKYAHVTFFFNDEIEKPFPLEKRILVPSPKVATYDLKPEMSAYKVAHQAAKGISSGKYDFVIINFANCDMVGHTGVYSAAVKAVEAVDTCVARVVKAALAKKGFALIIADHGNADEMTGIHRTSHTMNKVPCCLVGLHCKKVRLIPGALCDVAPTLLYLKGMPIPKEMTGKVLVQE